MISSSWERWDSSHIVQPFGGEVNRCPEPVETPTCCPAMCNVISSLPLKPSWLWREAGSGGG